jgi:hypothetical protein
MRQNLHKHYSNKALNKALAVAVQEGKLIKTKGSYKLRLFKRARKKRTKGALKKLFNRNLLLRKIIAVTLEQSGVLKAHNDVLKSEQGVLKARNSVLVAAIAVSKKRNAIGSKIKSIVSTRNKRIQENQIQRGTRVLWMDALKNKYRILNENSITLARRVQCLKTKCAALEEKSRCLDERRTALDVKKQLLRRKLR